MRQTSWAYFDSSVLVKRYVREQGSSSAQRLLRQYRFLSSALAPVEVLSLLRCRYGLGELTQRDHAAICARLDKDRNYWELVEVSEIVLERAEELVQKTGLRIFDALHLASVRTFQAASGLTIPFITANVRQRTTAEKLGLNLFWVE